MAKKDIDSAAADVALEIEQKEESGELETIESVKPQETEVHEVYSRRHRFLGFLKDPKGRAVAITLMLLGVIFAVPMTRYALLGVFVKKPVTITVVDEATGKPVTDALVRYARADATTDKNGKAVMNSMSVGDHPLGVEKKYYETYQGSYTVPVFAQADTTIKLKATGRLASVTVTNTITEQPIAGATVKIGDTSAVAADNGVATVALGIRSGDQPGTVSASGFKPVEITVNTQDISPVVDINLVPEGKMYFLSNRNGTLDVMSSALDGSGQEVVIKGTGREVPYEMAVEANATRTRLALLSRREGSKAMLYMVDTANANLQKIDDSATTYTPIGWAGDFYYYATYTDKYQAANDRLQIMAYNAASKERVVVDGSRVSGEGYTTLEQVLATRYQLVDGRLYYARCWQYANFAAADISEKASLMMAIDGKPAVLKQVDQTKTAYCDAFVKKPGLVYFRITSTADSNDSQFYRYQTGKQTESVQLNESDFLSTDNGVYYTSPNGQYVFWTESVDGKPVSFTSKVDGTDTNRLHEGDSMEAFGWFGDTYVVYGKNGNELYIGAASGKGKILKVADYYSMRGPGY